MVYNVIRQQAIKVIRRAAAISERDLRFSAMVSPFLRGGYGNVSFSDCVNSEVP